MAVCGGFALGLACARGREVLFRIHAPVAAAVSVCGSFRDWRCVPLVRGPRGEFWGRLAVSPGLYEYGFRVDGRWRLGRGAAQVDDGFGGRNDLLLVRR